MVHKKNKDTMIRSECSTEPWNLFQFIPSWYFRVGQTKLSSRHGRFKRGVTHLYNMVVCATGCNPLAYKGYGCYCGFLGSGFVIDGIDRYLKEQIKN